jgi:hypothetical protein
MRTSENPQKAKFAEFLFIGTGVKIDLVLPHFHHMVVARGAMDNWCENSLGGSSFSWFRGGPARAMGHFGELRKVEIQLPRIKRRSSQNSYSTNSGE